MPNSFSLVVQDCWFKMIVFPKFFLHRQKFFLKKIILPSSVRKCISSQITNPLSFNNNPLLGSYASVSSDWINGLMWLAIRTGYANFSNTQKVFPKLLRIFLIDFFVKNDVNMGLVFLVVDKSLTKNLLSIFFEIQIVIYKTKSSNFSKCCTNSQLDYIFVQ